MNLPDDALVPMLWVRQHYILRQDATERDMTTVELAAEFGHSSNWWQDAARGGKLSGCYQASPKSPWYIPRKAAMLFLSQYKKGRLRRGRSGRGRASWQESQAESS